MPQFEVLTIGHSTRPIDDFIRILQAHGVSCLVDVRTIPRSRHNPQFNQDALRVSLKESAIGYRHMSGLGGLRRPTGESVNAGWRNASFRGFADYMRTKGFGQALNDLISLATRQRVVIMCAEAVPWRCHRSLIADALLARGVAVEHIMSLSRRHPHTLTPFAKIQKGRPIYPAQELLPE